MLSTIKSKIIALTIFILFVISIVLATITVLDFNKTKKLIVKSCDLTILSLVEKINKQIITLERDALNLSLNGEFFYGSEKNRSRKGLDKYVLRSFYFNKYAVGGGIWFAPYVVDKNKKYFYSFVYATDTGKMYSYELFNNYLEQDWYKQIYSKAYTQSVIWAAPYYDSEGSKLLMVTVGSGIFDNNNKLIGISSVDWELEAIAATVSNMKPTRNSFAVFADKINDFVILSTYSTKGNNVGDSLKAIPWYTQDLKDKQTIVYKGVKYISFVKNLENGMILIVNVPEQELLHKLLIQVTCMILIILLTCIFISCGIYFILTKYINKPIQKLTEIAEKIGEGNLDTEIKISKPKEFADLAATFDKMTKDIKNYIDNLNKFTQEKEKIESELSIAKTIQYSVLPSNFYDETFEFDIFATMDTAKDVGGDFYDFFYINPSKFVFLIADVSGKGIPAALFMMTTKTLIKNIASENYSPKDFIEKVNKLICENNRRNFFLTMFAAIIDTDTGHISFINCGHNPPLIKRANGLYEYLKVNSNLVLGVAPNFNYNIEETVLNEDDIIFLYTDGVTEALNDKLELYGEPRLLSHLNNTKNIAIQDVSQIIQNVKVDLFDYAMGAEQSDDITMLAFKFNGGSSLKSKESIVLPAKIDKFSDFNVWFEEVCEKLNVGRSDMMKLALVAEEIFVNVTSYAYPARDGNVEIILIDTSNELTMQFIDSGVEYNPLEKQDPDVTLALNDRPIGGLGIYMVKKTVDFVDYEYNNNKNILTVKIMHHV